MNKKNIFEILFEEINDVDISNHESIMESKINKKEVIDAFESINKTSYRRTMSLLTNFHNLYPDVFNSRKLEIKGRGLKLELTQDIEKSTLGFFRSKVGTLSIQLLKQKDRGERIIHTYSKQIKSKQRQFIVKIYFASADNELKTYRVMDSIKLWWDEVVNLIGSLYGFNKNNIRSHLDKKFIEFGLS